MACLNLMQEMCRLCARPGILLYFSWAELATKFVQKAVLAQSLDIQALVPTCGHLRGVCLLLWDPQFDLSMLSADVLLIVSVPI